MIGYRHICVDGYFVSAAVNPCPWCNKTPEMRMPLDQPGEGHEEHQTWIWRIYCSCRVKSEATVSIRNTSKTNLSRFLDKLDELFDRWNYGNPAKAYEKKVIDLRKVPNLGIT